MFRPGFEGCKNPSEGERDGEKIEYRSRQC